MSGHDSALQHRPTIAQTPSYVRLKKRFRDLYTNNEGGIIDHPIRYIEDHKLGEFLKPLAKTLKNLVTLDELISSAILAKQEHAIAIGQQVDGLTEAEKVSINIQRSGEFWNEPKDLLLTLAACCLASLVQGWDGVANGNLGWTEEFGVRVEPGNGNDLGSLWRFALVQAVPWFSASILGSFLSDPLSEYTGRRPAFFASAVCSFASSVAGFYAQGWKTLLGTRVILGLGIGGKASIVPVLLSEVTPPSKRGRLLVSWQVFDAVGIFLGSIACLILRKNWRNQILSGALPAFGLLMAIFACCESPRWLIINGRYEEAFTTLLRLRKERRLALKELISIQYQIQAERSLLIQRPEDEELDVDISPFDTDLGKTSWWDHFRNMMYLPRIRRAAIAAMVVMIAQQLTGINTYAFLATHFYITTDIEKGINYADVTCDNGTTFLAASRICRQSNYTDYNARTCHDQTPEHINISIKDACNDRLGKELRSFGFAIGFGLANMIFSCLAYFLVENKEPEESDNIIARGVQKFLSSIFYFFTGSRRLHKERETPREPRSQPEEARANSSAQRNSLSSSPDSVPNNERPTTDGTGSNLENNDQGTEVIPIRSFPEEEDPFPEYRWGPRFRGRRFLLLMSLAAGTVTLLATSMIFRLDDDDDARVPMIIVFIIIFTAFYSPGAGAIPFLYCAEIFPNEGRELGMSWSTFWNFLGAGIVAFVVPFGFDWGHSRFLGVFAGTNALAFILVWFFVYNTDHTTTLEDYSYVFGKSMRDHARAQAMRIWHWRTDLAPSFIWEISARTGFEDDADQDARNGADVQDQAEDDGGSEGRSVQQSPTQTQSQSHMQPVTAPQLPEIGVDENDIELHPLPTDGPSNR